MPFATATDGTRLYYEVTGPEGGEPLLLVSGQGNDHRVWAGTREDLAARFRVVVFDHRGTGESDKPVDAAYTTRGFADDAVAVLDHLGIARAHVYGVSMGGRVAQWLATAHASRVGALVLGCTTVGNAHGIARSREVDVELASGEPLRLLPYLVSPAWSAEHRAFLAGLAEAAVKFPVPMAARRLHYQASEAHDGWELVSRIAAPTLVLHGSGDLVNVTANAALLVERIAGAESYIIQGARHAYWWEYREQASAVVLAFLQRHALR